MSATREMIMDEVRQLATKIADETDEAQRLELQKRMVHLLDELKKFPGELVAEGKQKVLKG